MTTDADPHAAPPRAQTGPPSSGRLDPARAGASAVSAYLIWGLAPVFFKFLGFASATEIVLQRAVWSAATLLILLAISGKLPEAFRTARSPRAMGFLAASAGLISINWWVFIYAVNSGQVLAASLGYYINPLMAIAAAVAFGGERFGPLRAGAVGLAALGVANQILIVGELPWISLTLACAFTGYGYIRRSIRTDARIGLFWETVIISIPSFAALWLLETHGLAGRTGHFFDGPGAAALLMLTGPVTAAPLLLFVIGARGLHFATIGILQFIAPTMQFMIGLAYGEAFTPAHLLTFALIWAGVAVFAADLLRFAAKQRRSAVRTGREHS